MTAPRTPVLVRLLAVVLVAGPLAGALTGCEEEIARPPALEARYTLWGAFDPTSDHQAVRVVAITDTISQGSTAPLPVTVTSEDLATGAVTPWRDSVVTFANGSVGHIYQGDLQPAYGSRHVLRVADVSGVETSALIAVPPRVVPIRQAPELWSGVGYPYLWIDAPRLNHVQATYVVEEAGCVTSLVTRELMPSAASAVEFGWRTLLPFADEAKELLFKYEGHPISVREITLSVEVASEDWRPPGGVFDPQIIIEPGTMSNVTHGLGFVGAAYQLRVTWRPTPDELARVALKQNRFDCGAI